jgi:hypothetical protein
LVPMVIFPASLSLAIVVPASNLGAASTGAAEGLAPESVHALSVNTLARAMAEIIRPLLSLMVFLLIAVGFLRTG